MKTITRSLVAGLSFVLALAWPHQAQASFLPSDVPGLKLWLDAGQGVTISGSGPNAGNVGQWNDITDGSNNTTAQNPVYNGANLGPAFLATGLNGHPALNFGASGFARLEYLSADLLTPGSARTVIVVAKASTTGGSLLGFRNGNPSATFDDQFYLYGPPNALYVYGDTTFAPPNATIPTNQFTTTPFISVLGSPGTGFKAQFNLNGTQEPVTQSGTVDTENGANVGFTVGGVNVTATSWDGLISAVLVYDHVLSFADMNNVGYYLGQEFGVSNTFQEIIPEPSTALLLGAGGLLLCWRRRNRRQD